MRHILRNLLCGVLLLSAFAFVSAGAPQASAASRPAITHTTSSNKYYHPPVHRHDEGDYTQNYRQGYQDGYTTCQHKLPPADTFNQGPGYSDGYNAGYQYCQSLRGQGHIKGYQDGYQDGFRTCQTEHQQGLYAKKTSPYDQGYGAGYNTGFQQGYSDCEASYTTNPSLKGHR